MQDQNEKAASRIQKIKDRNGLTGRGRTKWKFFDVMNEILGNRPATRPPVVIDTTDENPMPADAMTEDPPVSDEEENGDHSGETTPTHRSSSAVSDSEADTSRSSTPVSSIGKKRKRSQSKADMFEGLMTKLVKTMSDGLKESDRLFLEFEERRMEQYAQQRRETHQFQLQMAQLLAGRPNPSTPSLPPYYPSYSSQFYGTQTPAHYSQGTENNDEF